MTWRVIDTIIRIECLNLLMETLPAKVFYSPSKYWPSADEWRVFFVGQHLLLSSKHFVNSYHKRSRAEVREKQEASEEEQRERLLAVVKYVILRISLHRM